MKFSWRRPLFTVSSVTACAGRRCQIGLSLPCGAAARAHARPLLHQLHWLQGHREFPFWKSKIPPPLTVKIPENSRYENTPYTPRV